MAAKIKIIEGDKCTKCSKEINGILFEDVCQILYLKDNMECLYRRKDQKSEINEIKSISRTKEKV